MITIPTIATIKAQIIANINQEYGTSVNSVGKLFLNVLASVLAAMFKLQYLAVGNLQKNIWPDTADSAAVGGTLERFGLVKLGRNPSPAVAAQYVVSVTGTAGAIVDAESTFKSDDTSMNPGMLFILDSSYTLTGSGDTIILRALTPGTVSALANFNTLTSTAPIPNVGSSVSVQSTNVAPVDAETIPAYQEKVVQSFQLQPTGGSTADYVLWANEVGAPLAAVYPYCSQTENNEVDLYIEEVASDSTDGYGTPGSPLIAAVAASVEPQRPTGVYNVNYLPVVVSPVVITITGLTDPTLKPVITEALTAYLAGVRPFIAGVQSLANQNDTISANTFIFAILSAAPAAKFTSLSFTVDGASENSYTFDFGIIPYIPTSGGVVYA